jgi:DNA-binding response OmpR family regulator
MAEASILIIDDEQHIRETMQLALEVVGYRVEMAADGAEGLQKFGAGERWDLVLLDQRMPGMDGLELLPRMRERDPSARIVMVTAYGTIELAVEAMKAGTVDFLRKPFTPEVLRGAVTATLALPRQSVSAQEHSLTDLLPRAVPAPPGASQFPLIQFRTLNGYMFWPVELPSGAQETQVLRIRRAFEVKSPARETCYCAVDLATSIREFVRAEVQRDYPPDDPLWEMVCRSALADFLWQRAKLPPEVLPVYELTRDQLHDVRAAAGLGCGLRR